MNTDPILERALSELQASSSHFAAVCIRDSRVRHQYIQDIQAVSREFLDAVARGQQTPEVAAQRANALRNQIMDASRMRSSPTGRAYAAQLKQRGRTLAELTEIYAQRLYGRAFSTLPEGKQAAVFSEIVAASGRADERVIGLARTLGRVGQRLLLVSIAVAVYEISKAEDKPREVARQGVLSGAGIVGGWAAGVGAVATGTCAATAPVCVGVVALVGGLLFAFGADIAFGTAYPLPSRR